MMKVVLYRLRVLAFVVLLSLSMPVSPAHAVVILAPDEIAAKIKAFGEELVEMAEENLRLGTITSLVSTIWDFVGIGFNWLFDATNTVTQALVTGDMLMAQARMTQTDAVINFNWESYRMRENVRMTMDKARAGAGHDCRTLLLHENATSTDGFQDGITTMILSSMRYMMKGPGEAGNTTKFAAAMTDQRCINKFGSPIDGYPAKCVDMITKIGPFERSFVDADLSPFMLDGAVTLEVPPVETYVDTAANGENFTYMILRPENTKPEQKAFVAAFNYCMNLVGPRPSPPWGKELFTAIGMMDSDIFAQGLAIETGMDVQCAKLVAYYTRPNSKQADLIRSQKEHCIQAITGPGIDGFVTAKSLSQKFDNCEKGLSPYQAETLDRVACKSLEHYTNLYKSSALTPALLKETLQCNLNWVTWKTTVAERQGSLVDAVLGQASAKKIWSGMSSARGSSLANSGLSLYSYVLDEVKDMPESNVRTVNAPAKEKDAPVVKKGVPFSADEVGLPEVESP